MPHRRNNTNMGGDNQVFKTTCWIDIEAIRTIDDNKRQIVLNRLLRAYWKPVYCYLRRKGHSNEAAKDLTQGFFHEVVLGRNAIARADREKGRFRTFLLTALDNYAANVYHRERAHKRHPRGEVFNISEFEGADSPEMPTQVDPQEAFNYVWASELLDTVLTRVRDDCCKADKETHWNIFQARVVEPILEGIEAPPLPEICARYGVESEAKASNMIVTVKRRFSSVLRQCLRRHVESDDEVEEEFGELLKILSKGRAR